MAFQESLPKPRPRSQKPRIPYHCIRKIVVKAFRTHHSSFCRVLANTFAAFQESLPKPRPRLKSRAFPTTAFGKLLLKLCGQILRCFFCVYQYFHSGLALQSAAVQKPRIPYHCIPKIASPTFRVHSVCFCLVSANTFAPYPPAPARSSLPHSLPPSLTPLLPRPEASVHSSLDLKHSQL